MRPLGHVLGARWEPALPVRRERSRSDPPRGSQEPGSGQISMRTNATRPSPQSGRERPGKRWGAGPVFRILLFFSLADRPPNHESPVWGRGEGFVQGGWRAL